MKENLKKVRAFLDGKKVTLEEQKKSAMLTDEQKSKIDEALSSVNDALMALDAADVEATNEQLVAIFTKALEVFNISADTQAQAMQKEVEAKLQKIQAKLDKGAGKNEKFKAKLSLSMLKKSGAKNDFMPFSAGVDVSAYTPEAEVENVEIYHPLIGVTAGFDVSATSKTSIKVRTFEKGSGATAVVLNHGVKPELEYTGAQSVVNVSTYAGVVEGIADEDLEDNPELEAEIQQEALYELAAGENTAAFTLLDGVATAYGNAKFGTVDYADNKTALVASIDQIRQALGKRQSQICVAMNSSEWAKLKDLRNANGTPIDIQSAIGDVMQITDNTIAADTFYVWAKKFAKIKVYKAAKADWYKGVNVTTSEGSVTAVYSEWRTDESSIRVRQREVIYVTDSTTVMKSTFATVVEALNAEQA